MAECSKCRAEVAVYDHFCPKCGADVARGSVRASSDRQQARLCHLLALPGMVLMIAWPDLVLSTFVPALLLWLLLLAPINIVVPWVYRSHHSWSPTVRRHSTEVLNFQVLWTAVLYLLVVLSILVGISLYPFVWFGGIILVLFMAYDAGNGGEGRYLVRIPLFK